MLDSYKYKNHQTQKDLLRPITEKQIEAMKNCKLEIPPNCTVGMAQRRIMKKVRGDIRKNMPKSDFSTKAVKVYGGHKD